MRAKQILNAIPQSKVRLVYERFAVTRVATAFVSVALAHCIVQIALQALAYSANTSAGHTISRVIHDSDIPPVFATVDDGILKVCDKPTDASTCRTIASVGVPADPKSLERLVSLNNVGLPRRDVNASELSVQCIQALNWPNMILSDSRREDISFLVFQIWLLGLSIVTILNESIPHLMAALVTHGLSSIWSAFQACGGVNVLSGFWPKRMSYFVPILVLNVVAFLITSIVSYKLFKVYLHQTFKRVGYSDRMNVLYSYILTFSVALQLSAFIVICAAALWLDALCTGPLEGSATDKTLFRVLFVNVCVWTLPWIFIGWNSFRKENRLWSGSFFAIGLFILGTWVSGFPTRTFKRRFSSFPFFATMVVTSFVVLAMTLLLALVCWLNFGKGLPQYLKSQDLIDESIFVPVALSRKRRFSLRPLVLPGRREDGARDVSSSAEKLEGDLEVDHNDLPPAYSAVDTNWSAQYFNTDYYAASDRKLPTEDRPLTRSASAETVKLAVPEVTHQVERRSYVDNPSFRPQDLVELARASRVSDHSSLLSRWNVFRGAFDSTSPSRTSASKKRRESTRSSPDSSSTASSTIPHFRMDQAMSESSSSSTHSYVMQAPLRVGLPPRPNYLRRFYN